MKRVMMILCMVACVNARAQQLPAVQEKAMWANHIKIDGNIDDWGTSLNSFNTTNNFWYSIANDQDYIYLAIKKTYNITKAIARTGIQFYINPKGENSIATSSLVQFPVTVADNKRVPMGKWTEMVVSGIPAIPDSVISIYNEHGIKVAWEFSFEKNLYLYEIRIPKKLVGIDEKSVSFVYNICLMGIGRRGRTSIMLTPGLKMMSAKGGEMTEEEKAAKVDFDTVTEFWANYTLARKPD